MVAFVSRQGPLFSVQAAHRVSRTAVNFGGGFWKSAGFTAPVMRWSNDTIQQPGFLLDLIRPWLGCSGATIDLLPAVIRAAGVSVPRRLRDEGVSTPAGGRGVIGTVGGRLRDDLASTWFWSGGGSETAEQRSQDEPMAYRSAVEVMAYRMAAGR